MSAKSAVRVAQYHGLAEITRRALLSYLKRAKAPWEPQGAPLVIPQVVVLSYKHEKYFDKDYAALITPESVPAIYRVRHDRQLKLMKKAPRPIIELAERLRRELYPDFEKAAGNAGGIYL